MWKRVCIWYKLFKYLLLSVRMLFIFFLCIMIIISFVHFLIDEIDVPCIDMWGNIAENQSVFIPFKNPCEVCKCVNNLKTKCVVVICDEHIPTVSFPTSLILIVYIMVRASGTCIMGED